MDANIEGPALLIAFNVRFLREVLAYLESPAFQSLAEVLPELSGGLAPAFRNRIMGMGVAMPFQLWSWRWLTRYRRAIALSVSPERTRCQVASAASLIAIVQYPNLRDLSDPEHFPANHASGQVGR